MKYLSIFTAGLFVLIGFALQGEDSESTAHHFNPFLVEQFKIPIPYLDQLNGYRSRWHRVTGFEFSGLHWQQFIVIYMNTGQDRYKYNYLTFARHFLDYQDDEEVEEDEEDILFMNFAPGTIFVKENYSSTDGRPGKPISLTVMLKKEKGYDPENNDWHYMQSDITGNILLEGKASDPLVKQLCADCHGNMSERDHVFSTFFSSEKDT